jgi:glycosyltransferase involved in cell wall biosynthesis
VRQSVAMPLISIIVPAHDAGRFLAATLDSVLAQTHGAWECIVVDDASQDDTLAIADGYAEADSRIRAFRIPHGGVSAARNAGFRAGSERAEYATFMDSDDVWVPGALEALLDRARSDPAAIGAHGVAEFIDESGQVVRPGEYATRGRHRVGLVGHRLQEIPIEAPTDFSLLMSGTAVFPPGLILVKRAAYLSAGPFDESLTVGEDWHMLVRLSRSGPIAFLPDVILYYRRHDANLGASNGTPEGVHRALCASFHSSLNSAEQRHIARRAWRAGQRQRLQRSGAEIRSRGLHSPARTAVALTRCSVFALRFVRGYPRPVIHQPELTW